MTVCLTFDVEPDLHTEKYEGIEQGIPRILGLLDKYKIKATFFITCDSLARHPEIFRKLKREGHELALHGYKHERFDELSKKQKELQIQKAVLCFQKHLHDTPKGFRAPQFSIDKETLSLLQKYRFMYDSSFPSLDLLQLIFFPNKFFFYLKQFFSPSQKYKIRKNLYELSPSSFLLSFSSIVFRAFPQFLIRTYFKILKLFHKDMVFYAHSWDFIDVKGKIAKTFPKEKLIKNLDIFLKYSTKGNKFSRLIDLI